MAEINIAKQLLAARHEKKITQEELASYVGVSKAAVSKWESGVSFPDITLLPKLATYFTRCCSPPDNIAGSISCLSEIFNVSNSS